MKEKPKSSEMHPGPGFRVTYEIVRVDPEVVEGFRSFETPDMSDLMNRLYTMSSSIHNVTNARAPMLGPAITVKVFPGDNLMVHKALDIAQPGDVIVIDASASLMTAVLGDLVCTKARHRGVVGFVVDGLIRDLPAILRMGEYPVYARGVTPIGPLHRGPGEINHAISAGGVVTHPGDLIAADDNGVVVVPRDDAPELLTRLRDRAETEAEYTAAVGRGEFSNEWVDAALSAAGVDAHPFESLRPRDDDRG